ncbi:tumor necrosis factor receptor superfamily member 16-like isoform X2 [Ptychodera flava]|uniref:tumor necrosis factor receptor superfamily member 16-like isoform X2 n=1 Tax=Ptychodera flava TaxID=63121 RepID=UPI003969DDF1
MKVTHFILPLAVSIFHGMCVLAGNCNERQFLHNGVCCQMCRPGYRLVSNCTLSSASVCQPCQPGSYSNDFTADYTCKEVKPCNNSHEYIKVPAPENGTLDNACVCQRGWHYNSTGACVQNPTCPPGRGIHDGACQVCDEDTYSETWSSVDGCQSQPKCRELGLNVTFEGNATHRRICSHDEDMVSFPDLSSGNTTGAVSLESQYSLNNMSNATEAMSTVTMATTLPSISLMMAVEKETTEMSVNYKLIVVASIVGGGLLIILIAFVVTEMRRVYRRKKGLIQTSFPRTKNSKGMGVNFADKRRTAKERAKTQQAENETEDANESTPMLGDNVDGRDISVIIWEPIKQNKELEAMRLEELTTSNKEERVTCV